MELKQAPCEKKSRLSPGGAGRCFAVAVEMDGAPRFGAVFARWPDGLDLPPGRGARRALP